MSGPDGHDDNLLVEAYCDGELDAVAALTLERRMAGEPLIKAHYERVLALKSAIQRVPRERVSEDTRARILAAALGGVRSEAPVRSIFARHSLPRRFDFRQLAASMVAAAVLASGGTALILHGRAPSSELAAMIAGHQRSLLAASAFDVASSDRHTVKPWFDAKLAISPLVPDLADAGFPLAGGRIDIVGGKPVPTMVYRRRGHLISVVAVPDPGSKEQSGPEVKQSRDGFLTESWRGKDFRYTAVSDVPEDELEAFCDAWRRGVQAS